MHTTFDRIDSDESTLACTLSPLTPWGFTMPEGGAITDLTADEFGEMVRPAVECDEVIDTLTDGWNLPSPDLFQYFRHTYKNAARLEEELEQERRTANRLFDQLKKDGLEERLDTFIVRKRWFPAADRQTARSFMTEPIPGSQHNPIVVDNDEPSPPTTASRTANCWHCRRQGHVKKCCPTRLTTQRRR